MRKLKSLIEPIYFILFVIYEQIVYSCLVFGKFPSSFLLIALLSVPIGIFFNIICQLFARKVNIIITYILTIFVSLITCAQFIYYKMYETIISFASFTNGGQVTQFMDIIIDKVLHNWYGVIALLLPVSVLIILHIFKQISFEKIKGKGNLIKLSTLIVVQAICFLIITFINPYEMYSNKNLYYNIHVPKITASRMGLFTTMRLDFQRFVTGFEEKLTVETAAKQYDSEEEYNVLDINFDKLIKNENNETIKQMHEYFKDEVPTNKNEYTGMFKGKNLIVLVGESFSELGISEELTPTLYKMYNEGFQFDNLYTPIFPVSTADGEYITDTALLPKEGAWSIHDVVGNYMPYSYPNALKKFGYTANAYHNYSGSYYDRDKYIKTMGYSSYLAVGFGLENRMDCNHWPNSDTEMMKVTTSDYINNDKFVAYYMTVSGHMNYMKDASYIVTKHWDEVKELPYSERAKGYIATQIELNNALEQIINDLTKAGKLDDTVIAISGDHYPYGLKISEINEISTYERDNNFEKYNMPFLVWNSAMKEPIKVDKIGSSLDILPTMLNLFGIEYDSRLLIGKDILSNSAPLVIFSDRSFITDKRQI